MFKGIGGPRGPIAPGSPREPIDRAAGAARGRLQGTLNLAARNGPPDQTVRPRTALPLPAREPSPQATQARPGLPDLAASRLHSQIQAQAAEVHQLRATLASLDQSLARLPSLDGPGAFAAAWAQQKFETERAEVVQKLAVAEPKLAAAEPKLAEARGRLAISTDAPPANTVTPASGRQEPSGMRPRTGGPTLGELFAQERRLQQDEQSATRQQLLRTALPGGGAVMQRLKERAGRQHPTTNAEQWRARLKGTPQPMEGKRKEAFEARVRTDVLAVARTGRMEPRLAAGAMQAAVRDGTLGLGILPQDRQLLLDVLERMAKGGSPPGPTGRSAAVVRESTTAVPPQPGTAPATQTARPAGDRFADQRLPALPLPPGTRYPEAVSLMKKYAGEETGAVWGTQVTYLNAEQRQQFQLHMHDGKLCDAQGRAFDTRGAQSSFLETEGTAIFVMNPDGDIYAANDRVPGKFQHSSFLAGAPVAAAGEIEVHDGVVKFISGKSGHYRPSADQLDQMVHNLKSQGAAEFAIDQTTW